MTLLITLIAAVVCTAVWYEGKHADMKLGLLCWIYWGSGIMWFVDACFEYAELGAEYFSPAAADMLNDTFLGLSAVVLGLLLWIAVLLIRDPKGKTLTALRGKN